MNGETIGGESIWLVVALAWPLLLLAGCLSARLRTPLFRLLPVAPLPAFIAALMLPDGSFFVLPDALLGLAFLLDGAGALLLGTAALLWMAAGLYANVYRRASTDDARFTIWWLATLTGSLGVFIAADLPGFYLFFTIVSLSAYWLAIDDNTPAVRRAGAVYVSFALLGEAFLLFAFILLAIGAPDGSLLIGQAVAALPDSPFGNVALGLIILGFGIKIGLVPLHVWMPLTYSAAPIPVAAVLSGAAVKAGVIGLIRFLPFEVALPDWGEALAALGMFSAFYGVAIGITQSNPRTVLAYSSISQMGVIAAVLGMGLAAGDLAAPILAAFYALHHILVKGGLFLALGVVTQGRTRGLWPVVLPASVIALGLGGLPLTGGALAKIAVKDLLGDGWVSLLAMGSAAGSTLLMLHFISRLRHVADHERAEPASSRLVWPWLFIALCAVVLPWLLFPIVTQASWGYALSPAMLWDSLWPVLAGLLLAFGLRRIRHMLPAIPPGDVLAAGDRLMAAGGALGRIMERFDWHLRQWPVAATALLIFAVIFAVMSAGR
jgi:formate hydrogenlyase subunit 3/multisubunit Na+/H+ antiporter MnhD subunit